MTGLYTPATGLMIIIMTAMPVRVFVVRTE